MNDQTAHERLEERHQDRRDGIEQGRRDAITARPQSFIKWDGTVSFTMIMGLGLSWAVYSWTETQDLKHRMLVRETSAADYRKRVDVLEIKIGELVGLRSDILVLKEIMFRVERKLDGTPPLPPREYLPAPR